MRRVFILVLKAALTASLIYLSVRAVSFEVLRERISAIDMRWVALGLAVVAVQIAVQAVRWQQIIRAAGQYLPMAVVLRTSFIASFFNQTLPSTIGGDAVRIWILARTYATGWKVAAYSVLVDRAIGVFALACLVTICLPWTFSLVHDPAGWITVVLVGLAGIVGGLIFAALSAAGGTSIERLWGATHLIAAAAVLRRLATPIQNAIFVAAASLAIHLLTVVVAWTSARAIGASVGFGLVMCLVPPVILIATVPITIAGWGLRESLMITAFGLAGLDTGDALVLSLLLGVTYFIIGLLGGALWIASRYTAPSMRLPMNPFSIHERR